MENNREKINNLFGQSIENAKEALLLLKYELEKRKGTFTKDDIKTARDIFTRTGGNVNKIKEEIEAFKKLHNIK